MVSGSISVERNISIPMRDGVTLAGDLYRSSGNGSLPTLLQRTPYNKSGSNGAAQAFALRAAEAGYAVIIQDVRGRFVHGAQVAGVAAVASPEFLGSSLQH